VTETEFRRVALSLPEVKEGSHMGHPDFRVCGKLFATLRYPRRGWGMVSVSRDDQRVLMGLQPESFVPAAGAWGRAGQTTVQLKTAKKALVRQALKDAWRKRAPAGLRWQSDDEE
jgi:hypothetical protein